MKIERGKNYRGRMNRRNRYKNDPLVSVITPTWNRRGWLPLTLQSLIKQTYHNWECILINDAGEDVEDIVKKFNDPRIKYFVNEKNLDLAGTRNVGLGKYSGEYGILLDDDDQLYPECIEFRMSRIKKLGVDVVYSRVLQVFYKNVENRYQYAGDKVYWRSNFDKDLLLIQNVSPCNGILWSRKAQESAGEFDVSLTTSEDWSWWVEMSRKYDFHESYCIDSECSYRMDSSQMSGTRTGFTDHLPYLYKKWRKYAKNLEFVSFHQNEGLKARGLNPSDYGL